MIRDEKLIDKLVADLHFHNYLFVNEGDNIFTDRNESISKVENILTSIGLNDKLNPHTDFFHGGNVIAQRTIDHIYDYIDDVYIDYFFRSQNFHAIKVPKGFCYEQITSTGIIHPDKDTEVILDLNNIYDRCTFVEMIFRLFGLRELEQDESFQNNHFLSGLQLTNTKSYFVIENEYPYGDELQLYIDKNYKLNSKFKPSLRAKEIVLFNQFYDKNKYSFRYEGLTQLWIDNYWQKIRDYILIKDNHFFGEYCIEDVLMLYVLLIDKLVLSEEKLTTFLSAHLDVKRDNSILNEFRKFENKHTDYKEIEPFINSKDLYLRFTSRERSRAFKFERQDDLFESIQLFEQKPIRSLFYNNPLQLPYLYNSLNYFNMYVKIVDKGECFSTTMEFIDGVYANKAEWEKHSFYPKNGMVGELVKRTPSAYIIKIMDGIYVPMTKKGIKEISYEEYESGLVNNTCSGMDSKQERINNECDNLLNVLGIDWQVLPDMRQAFKQDIIQNITKLTCDFKRNIFLPDLKESFVIYATDMSLEYKNKSGRTISPNTIRDIANQVGDVYKQLFTGQFDDMDKEECINRTISLTNNPNAREIIDKYYHEVNMRWSWS